MDLLKAGPSQAVLDPDLLRVLKKLADDLGSRLAALKALRAYLDGRDAPGPQDLQQLLLPAPPATPLWKRSRCWSTREGSTC